MTHQPNPAKPSPLHPRTNARGDIAVGPTYRARLMPWVRYGAPIVSVIILPISILPFDRVNAWIAYPAAIATGYLALVALLALGLALVHRTTWLTAHDTLERGRLRIPLASIDHVLPDFRPQGTTSVWVASHAAQQAHTARDEPRVSIAASGWDERSYEGVRCLLHALNGDAGPSRAHLLERDRTARLLRENRQLAQRYQIPWEASFENPEVFRAALDARRLELARQRR